ncbi:hypothetical protein GCM10022254_52730 [Actinomadura meridiana]|uniref:Uncharacterized protein n=1 Tax=Actinomadura meridiana TaxID=559626 RepID=A0ABP8CE22_9ACTN
MPDHDEAIAVALDAYQRQLLSDETLNHRTDRTLAEPLIELFVERLARYADRRDLDVQGAFTEIHEQSIDRGGHDHDPRYSFRLGAEVQFRQLRTASKDRPPWRGFISALVGSPDDQARCTVRIPGINKALPVTAGELEPADSFLPMATRTAGTVIHAREAESTIVDIAVRLKRAANNGLVADEQAFADLAQLTTRLGVWSGGRSDAIMRHLHERITAAAQEPAKGSRRPDAAARLAATDFPQDPASFPSEDPPPATRPKPDDPPNQRKHRP